LSARRTAVVLERIARGGGATRWYILCEPEELGQLAATLQPGSSVSVYFDDRLKFGAIDEEARASIAAIAERDGSAVIGAVTHGSIEIDVVFPSAPAEVDEFVEEHDAVSFVYGAFPGRDNDGEGAVTLTLPDEDGVVRSHPH
jgi:hypothetical protein